jgi:hypothetical protein
MFFLHCSLLLLFVFSSLPNSPHLFLQLIPLFHLLLHSTNFNNRKFVTQLSYFSVSRLSYIVYNLLVSFTLIFKLLVVIILMACYCEVLGL